MAIQRQTRHVGDLRTPILAQLKRPNGDVEDVTGKTVKFKMTDQQGVEVVTLTDTGVTKNDEANGKVQYQPVVADVDTEGTFYGYFVVLSATETKDTFPAAKGEFEIKIEADS